MFSTQIQDAYEILSDTKKQQDYDKEMTGYHERLKKNQSIYLPIELNLIIFSYLPPLEILTITLVCKAFTTPAFWENIFQIFHPTLYQQLSLEKNIDYKNAFQIDLVKFSHLYMSISKEKIDTLNWEQKIVAEKLLVYLDNNENSRRGLIHYKNCFFYNPSYYDSENQMLLMVKSAASMLMKIIFNEADEKELKPFLFLLTDESANPNLASIYKQFKEVTSISYKETINNNRLGKSSRNTPF